MRCLARSLLAALAVLSLATVAQARSYSTHYGPPVYWSAGLANSNTNLNSGQQYFDLVQLNLSFGYQLSSTVSTELWSSVTIVPERDSYVSEIENADVSVSSNSFGGFLVGRFGQQVYGSARAGFLASSFTYSSPEHYDEADWNLGLAYGFGVGFHPINDDFAVEFNYTALPDVRDPLFSEESYSNSMVGVGFKYSF